MTDTLPASLMRPFESFQWQRALVQESLRQVSLSEALVSGAHAMDLLDRLLANSAALQRSRLSAEGATDTFCRLTDAAF